ncbi:MAG: hypothetical protein IKC30_00495 [Rikenellaceae bacterium]|nr:hypothetical protein [Rikenellaceae bacterium]MBR2419374.1 hypothetical protein [Rikenellaceae bacterium]MBR2931205.1 hypothetical protein [Rikenellaceae bacterium]MBR3800086.1 hypothetical protein [Rikenellaceae bacterium]
MRKVYQTLKYIIPLLLIGYFFVDRYTNPYQRIYRYIERHCSFGVVDTCYIDMEKALGVKYDLIYHFTGNLHPYPELIAQDLRLPYSGRGLGDNEERIILVRDDKVVYERTFEPPYYYGWGFGWDAIENFPFREKIFTVTIQYGKFDKEKQMYEYRYVLLPKRP